MKTAEPRQRRQIENLHKFFPLLVWLPWLRPLVRQLIKLPPNRLFEWVYMACVNLGVHFVAVPPTVGRTMLRKKLANRFRAGRRNRSPGGS